MEVPQVSLERCKNRPKERSGIIFNRCNYILILYFKLLNSCSNTSFYLFGKLLSADMVIWKEREHELDDIRDVNDDGNLVALRGWGILKFFNVPSMRPHGKLLEYILRMWNPEQKYFEVGPHILTVEVEDIYFLTGLSRHGAHIPLNGP